MTEPNGGLEDLDLGDEPGIDVTGGINSTAGGAPGVRPGGALWGGSGRIAEKPSERALNRIAEDKPAPKKAKVIVDTRWLVPDGKQPGKWKRAEGAIEKEKLGLEVTVNTSQAPDGTPASFEIFQQGRSGDDASIAKVSAQVKDGAAVAEWVCVINPPPEKDYLEPKLYFKVAVGEDSARSVLIAVESWIELAVESAPDTPRDCAYIVKLPHGRETRGKTEKGRARILTPPGNVEIRLAEETSGKDPLPFTKV